MAEARPKRTLEFLCVKHANLVTMRDGGNDRDGGEGSERQQVRRILEKRFILPDGSSIPMFMLAKVPVRLSPGDKFDNEFLTDRGGSSFVLAKDSPDWMAIRDERLQVAAAKLRAAQGKADELLQKKVVDAVTALIGARDAEVDARLSGTEVDGKAAGKGKKKE